MSQQEQFKPATNIDEAWAAVDAFPLEPGDPRFQRKTERRSLRSRKVCS